MISKTYDLRQFQRRLLLLLLLLLMPYSSLRTLAARWTMSLQYSRSQTTCSVLSIDMSVQSVMSLIQERCGIPLRLLPGIMPVMMSFSKFALFSSSNVQNTAAYLCQHTRQLSANVFVSNFIIGLLFFPSNSHKNNPSISNSFKC